MCCTRIGFGQMIQTCIDMCIHMCTCACMHVCVFVYLFEYAMLQYEYDVVLHVCGNAICCRSIFQAKPIHITHECNTKGDEKKVVHMYGIDVSLTVMVLHRHQYQDQHRCFNVGKAKLCVACAGSERIESNV